MLDKTIQENISRQDAKRVKRRSWSFLWKREIFRRSPAFARDNRPHPSLGELCVLHCFSIPEVKLKRRLQISLASTQGATNEANNGAGHSAHEAGEEKDRYNDRLCFSDRA